jgi:hypothetical protein
MQEISLFIFFLSQQKENEIMHAVQSVDVAKYDMTDGSFR